MKKILSLLLTISLLTACGDDDTMPAISLGEVSISLTGASDDLAGISIVLRNTQTGSVFTSPSDSQGKATFSVTPGIYEATASGSRSAEGFAYLYNGTSGQLAVMASQTTEVTIELKSARTSQVVIKEVYNGGVLLDDGSKNFHFDKYIILYNNSALKASLSNLCFGIASPYNGQANNKNIDANGHLTYESEGFTPALNGIWYFPQPLDIEPYQQVVVNVHGAIDNTQTVSQSVNFANPAYYAMYDPESGYNNTSYYPTPADVIPTSHYLKAVRLGLGNAWALSTTSPAVYIFQVKDALTPDAYANTEGNQWYDGGQVTQSGICIKVPNAWIVDAVEVFSAGYKDSSVKRLTSDIDAGYVWLTGQLGHSVCRNVDKAATEALAENEGKLVYNYHLGVDPSTDPSGIDAEASIQQGAHIVYQDTNNSTNDFHERQRCTLKE